MGLVQQTTGAAASAGSTLALTNFGAAPTQGNIVVVGAAVPATPSGGCISSISQTGVSGWVQAVTFGGEDLTNDIWVGSVGDAASAAITLTLSSAVEGGQINAWAAEFSGFTTSTDGTNHNDGSSSTASSGSITTSYPFDLLIALASCDSVTLNSPTNGFVAGTAVTTETFCALYPSYQVVAANNSYSTGWTVSSSNTWLMVICALHGIPAPTNWPPLVILPPG